MKRLGIALVSLLSMGGCGVSHELYNARVNELQKIRADLDAEQKTTAELKTKCSDCEKMNASLKTRLEALGQDVNQRDADLAQAQKVVDELRKAQAQAEQRAKQYRDLVAKFQSMVDSGKLKVEIRDGLMLVKLADNILFDPGKTDLKPAGKEALKEVGQILAAIEGRKFQVAGHTDNQGLARGSKYKDNWDLSAARALQVVHFLIKEAAMPAERLSAAGFADQMPIAKNDTEEGRKQNRRIEVVLMPNIEDLPKLDDGK